MTCLHLPNVTCDSCRDYRHMAWPEPSPPTTTGTAITIFPDERPRRMTERELIDQVKKLAGDVAELQRSMRALVAVVTEIAQSGQAVRKTKTRGKAVRRP